MSALPATEDRALDRQRQPKALRRRTRSAGIVAAVLMAFTLAGLLVIGTMVARQIADATADAVSEQRVADTIVRGVVRQLALISLPLGAGSVANEREFHEVGGSVQDALRQFLLRSQTLAERQRVEEVKAEHESMEVAGAKLLVPMGLSAAEARDVRQEAILHAQSALNALDGFAQLRATGFVAAMEQQGRLVQRLLVGGGLLLLGVGVVAAWLLTGFVERHVVRPLNVLTEGVSRIGQGDLSARVPTAYDQEFHTLASAVNQMSTRLDEARTALEDERSALAAALEQVHATQSELIQSEKLGAIGRMTAGLAHELNNPLATVLGYSELLATSFTQDSVANLEELRTSYVEPIVREARRARLLVRSLLHFARRSEGDVGPVRLREALRVVEELRRFAYEQAGVALDMREVEDLVVIGERQRMQGVFLNIMNNALDVLRPRGTGMLVIRTERVGDLVQVHLEDNGPGLSEPDRVFEPFYTTKDVGKGTGLGLALSARFMDSFGGRISAENLPGGGARFTLSFQATDDAPPVRAPLETPPSASALPLRRAARRQTVLVLEDEAHLQRLHRNLLARLDVDVQVVGSVAEAKPLLEDNTFDAILSDVKMPGESGLEFYHWLLARDATLHSRFLFVTGDMGDEELAAIAEARPDAFLLKPFDAREYLARVAALLD